MTDEVIADKGSPQPRAALRALLAVAGRSYVERVFSCMQDRFTSGGIQVEQSDPVP